ncbi:MULTISPECIES: helix-turn-helix transcriptional regulator [Rhodococcus]|uniref:helix-turn-helix transcriptional regulator n=1 Tax=Rhodococcus TaxID=1827 RepID=UPI001E387539|nr:helix-turn-helix transcriptional regulator [Rhodococcus pyridinivorans]MCD2116661.1 LuxR C-terminal-related transcriptional regulator [Rhodococcus pyridinivorans]MCZ4625396.1 LuxR C-terminal-related transcriptional regulator [Rhodococcus pyridinivorans]MCZ4646606.1 LuxR C-terminal-related transcriptional regulator [Rhodococcus pyridinivorans]MDJ0483218.1 LuxR C-terminal-related transcriptional regulator [Rhodococcus pyridinivorans]MDV7252841.1 LuxR C-terminal-related transcriptional regulat
MLFTSVTMLGADAPPGRAAKTVAHIEYGTSRFANTYRKLARTRTGVRTIREAIDCDIRDSLPYSEILEPQGMDDEVRLVFRGRDGRVWGGGTLMRAPGRRFDADDVAALAGCVGEIGDGLRLSLLRECPRLAADASPGGSGPAVVVVGADNEIESTTPQAVEYLERLGAEGAFMLSAVVVAVRFRYEGAAARVVRVRTEDGQWLVLRAGSLDGRGESARIVVAIEPAQPGQLVALTAALHGLTERETDVLARVLAGETRTEIARGLFVSPYTVQDHLKSIYAKTGVNSRQELVARLFFTHCLPRVGTEIGPDGWFVEKPAPTSVPVGAHRKR